MVRKRSRVQSSPRAPDRNMIKDKRLYRSRINRQIAGICGGVAEYLTADPVLVRIAAVALFFLGVGAVVPIYLIMWLIVPEAPEA